MALELGPCQVEYDSADLGKTNGGVTVTIKDDSVDLVSDQYGSSPEDTIITGTSVEVTMALAEIDISTLESILQPQIDTAGETSSADAVAGRNKVGTSLLTEGAILKLTKYAGGAPSTDAKDVLVFPAAAPLGDVELSYDASNQRVLNATFKCFPGIVNSEDCIYYIGDESATFA